MVYNSRLCYGTIEVFGNDLLNKHSREVLREFNPGWFNNGTVRPTGIKRIRLVCPKCGRRLLASVSTCGDGCCLYFKIPPHKPRMWWKRKVPRWERRRK